MNRKEFYKTLITYLAALFMPFFKGRHILYADGKRKKFQNLKSTTGSYVIENVSRLRTLDPTSFPEGNEISLEGYDMPGDGGGGIVYPLHSQATVNNRGGYSTGTSITMTVDPLRESISSGAILEFTGGGVFTITADAAVGDTSITGNLTVMDVADKEQAGLQDDGGTVFAISIANPGRWKRQYDVLRPEFFGEDDNVNSQFIGCFNALSNKGGVIDARNYEGVKTIGSNIFTSVRKPYTLLLGKAVYEFDIESHTLTLNSNQRIVGYGTKIQPTTTTPTGYKSLTGIFETKIDNTIGSISSESNSLSVNDVSNIDVGDLVAIEGAQGSDANEQISLTSSIDSTTTTIPVSDLSNFPGSGTFLIENEVIKYTKKDSTNFLSVERGALGTTATSHTSGANVGLMNLFRAEVESISGTTITLDQSASFSVTGSDVFIGSQNVYIEGDITIDGRDEKSVTDPLNHNVVGVGLFLCNTAYIGSQVKIINSNHAGLYTESSYNCVIKGEYENNSRPGDRLGASIFIMRGSNNNYIAPTKLKKGNIGLFIDDRTTSANPFDGQSNGNVAYLPRVEEHRIAVVISASSDNHVHLPYSDTTELASGSTPIKIQKGTQGAHPRNARRNTINAGYLKSSNGTAAVVRDKHNSITIEETNNKIDNRGANKVRILNRER